MKRHRATLRSATAAAVDMSYRPNPRANLPRSYRGYCDNSSGSSPQFQSNSPAAPRPPNYNATPPPLQYYPNQPYSQQPRHPAPGYPNYPQFRPQNAHQFRPQNAHQFRPPNAHQFRPQNTHQFRPQNTHQFQPQNTHQHKSRPQFRPRSRPPDHREWVPAKLLPPPQCERFTVLSYNVLADYLATDHYQMLYSHIPHYMLSWNWRRRNINFEIGLWSPDIMCFQEVDRFRDIEEDLKQRGYTGIWKMRTGNPVDGCAIFWRDSRFKLVHEESIEYSKHCLRDNVAQICVFESSNRPNDINGTSSLSTSSTNLHRVVVCNIHVLFNPKRGDIKLGQIRVLLDRAHAVSKLWDDAPVVMCGDFNCTPKSPMYNFIKEGKLDLSEVLRYNVSGQDRAESRPPRHAFPNFRAPARGFSLSNENHTGPRDDNESLTRSFTDVSDETVLAEPSCECLPSKSSELSVSVESNSAISPEVSVADAALDEKHACLSFNELVDETANEDQEDNDPALSRLHATEQSSFSSDSYISFENTHGNEILKDTAHIEEVPLESSKVSANEESPNVDQEDRDSLLSRLHNTGQSLFPSDLNISSENTHGHEILKDTLFIEDVPLDRSKLLLNRAAWTPMEIETATGSQDCRVMKHLLKLTSSYTEAESSSSSRDSDGEPLVTSYHKLFLGTVDYIWHSESLQTARVLAPIPKDVMQQQTRGFPTKKWGSDHIALVSEFVFVKDASSNSTS